MNKEIKKDLKLNLKLLKIDSKFMKIKLHKELERNFNKDIKIVFSKKELKIRRKHLKLHLKKDLDDLRKKTLLY